MKHMGLSSNEAQARLQKFGPNALPEKKPELLIFKFLRQFNSPLIYILLFALLFDFGLWIHEGAKGIPVEAVAIGLILLINAVLGTFQEFRSESALSRLKELASPKVWVLRDGKSTQVQSDVVVPGDWVRLEAGDRVPADGQLRQAQGVLLDEAVLTGESVPVDKSDHEKAFSGTLLVRGTTFLEVTHTGPKSSMGKLATLLGEIEVGKTPLEIRLNLFGKQIAFWVLVLAVLVAVGGVLAEGPSQIGKAVVFAIALAVAAVPEGLPAILTLTLALGMERMARRKAVVRRLSAVEALGSVTVIATDKTGTLTENQMEVLGIDSENEEQALTAMVLANDADLATGAGDPMELGLLRFAASRGVESNRLEGFQSVSQKPFDSEWKYMRVTAESEGKQRSFLKGAPEVILALSNLSLAERKTWAEKAQAHAAKGYRVLALAQAEGETEKDLEFLGLAMFWDPPRAEVPDAIRRAQAAGIRVVMITGDHPVTALSIAGQIGILGDSVLTGSELQNLSDAELSKALKNVNVFARVQPEHKLRLVESLQKSGEIVAMTGDGVNDAPALKRSNVGLAMGSRGSDVSREVSDIVLLDDNFATIVSAIEEGRSIYENIQKFLRFLFSTNFAEVLLVSVGAMLAFFLGLKDHSGGILLPLTAVQILWINLMTDGLPALMLALDRNPKVMLQAPRAANSPLLDRLSLRYVFSVGSVMALVALGLLGIVPKLGYSLEEARTTTFHFIAVAQLFCIFPARHTDQRPEPNKFLILVIAVGLAIQSLVMYLPAAITALGSTSIPPVLVAVAFGTALLVWGAAELIRKVVWSARP